MTNIETILLKWRASANGAERDAAEAFYSGHPILGDANRIVAAIYRNCAKDLEAALLADGLTLDKPTDK